MRPVLTTQHQHIKAPPTGTSNEKSKSRMAWNSKKAAQRHIKGATNWPLIILQTDSRHVKTD
jgi:hypothetical protein